MGVSEHEGFRQLGFPVLRLHLLSAVRPRGCCIMSHVPPELTGGLQASCRAAGLSPLGRIDVLMLPCLCLCLFIVGRMGPRGLDEL